MISETDWARVHDHHKALQEILRRDLLCKRGIKRRIMTGMQKSKVRIWASKGGEKEVRGR